MFTGAILIVVMIVSVIILNTHFALRRLEDAAEVRQTAILSQMADIAKMLDQHDAMHDALHSGDAELLRLAVIEQRLGEMEGMGTDHSERLLELEQR